MLGRPYRPGIDVELHLALHYSHFIPFGNQNTADGGRSDTFPYRGHNSADDKNVSDLLFLRLGSFLGHQFCRITSILIFCLTFPIPTKISWLPVVFIGR